MSRRRGALADVCTRQRRASDADKPHNHLQPCSRARGIEALAIADVVRWLGRARVPGQPASYGHPTYTEPCDAITFATRRKDAIAAPASKSPLTLYSDAVRCTSWKTRSASLSISSEMSALMIWCSFEVYANAFPIANVALKGQWATPNFFRDAIAYGVVGA